MKINEDEDDNNTSISFDIESDQMEEDVEEIYFEAKEWEEENMEEDL